MRTTLQSDSATALIAKQCLSALWSIAHGVLALANSESKSHTDGTGGGLLGCMWQCFPVLSRSQLALRLCACIAVLCHRLRIDLLCPLWLQMEQRLCMQTHFYSSLPSLTALGTSCGAVFGASALLSRAQCTFPRARARARVRLSACCAMLLR
jgi:hypothetical protein